MPSAASRLSLSSTLVSITSGFSGFLHIAISALGQHIKRWTMIGEPHDAQASPLALSPASLLTGESSSSLAALAVSLLLRLVGLAFFFVGLSSPALSVAVASMPVSVLRPTSLDVSSICGLTGLALATTSLLLAGRGDGNSVPIFGVLSRRGVARGVLFGKDLRQEATDVGSGTRNVAEPRDVGELSHVDLSVRVSVVLSSMVRHTLGD